MRARFLSALLLAVAVTSAAARQTPLPAPPADYVLDQAGVLSPAQKSALAGKLAQFERDTSNQLWVCILPQVPDDYAMEDFTQRTAEAWKVGRKQRDNGIVLFVFPQSRQTRIEVGYGLEGAVPDALASGIINAEMIPSFRAGDMAGGIVRGADALMAASRGEYHGSGRTMGEEQGEASDPAAALVFWIILIVILVIVVRRSQSRGGTVYSPHGRRDVYFPGNFGGGFGSGGEFGGGGFGGGSIGGGGGFGGGGASGRW